MAFVPHSDAILWRISTSPPQGGGTGGDTQRHMPVEATFDWSGGLVWLEIPHCADAGSGHPPGGGDRGRPCHADPRERSGAGREVEVFQPQAPAIERLSRGLKQVFDPQGLLQPGPDVSTM